MRFSIYSVLHSLVQSRTLHTATNAIVKSSANPAGSDPQLVQPSVYLSKMLAILNLLTALELVVLGNQLAVTYRKLVQTVSQALHFVFGKVILRLSGRRNILVLQ